jgi:hypothetical protein
VFSFSTPVPNASSQFNFNAPVPVSYVGLPFNNPPVPASYVDPQFNSNNAIFDGSQLDLSWNLAPVVDNQADSALYPDASIQDVGQIDGGFDLDAPKYPLPDANQQGPYFNSNPASYGSQVDLGSQMYPVLDSNTPIADVGQTDLGFDPHDGILAPEEWHTLADYTLDTNFVTL